MGYKEYRCAGCKKLLCKGLVIEGEIEVKCRHCHALTQIKESSMEEWICMIAKCPNRKTLSRS